MNVATSAIAIRDARRGDEARLSLVVEDDQVDDVTHLIRTVAKVGSNISGWIYVSAVEKVFPIGGDEAKTTAP